MKREEESDRAKRLGRLASIGSVGAAIGFVAAGVADLVWNQAGLGIKILLASAMAAGVVIAFGAIFRLKREPPVRR